MNVKRIAGGLVGAALVVGVGWPVVRMATAPTPPPITAAAEAHRANVRILRDEFGVPHVFGKSDADAAFGLAYAHAEDDWPLIQGVMAASRGELGRLVPSQRSLANDFYAGFVDIDAEIEATWDQGSPELKALLAGYAEGLNTYAADHPDEVNARLLPITAKDVARGFVHKLPLMMKVDKLLKKLAEGEVSAGDMVWPGSNAIAVHRSKTDDDTTRLIVNAHQPWTGPVTFYEAHVHSEEGWNTAGALFPGAPFILHGHNDDVGWALTVNQPDGADLYAMTLEGDTYKLGDEWKPLESRRIWLPYETWWGTAWIPQTVRSSVHGPVFEKGPTPVAVKTVAAGQGVRAAEQWYRMNKARSTAEFQEALAIHAIPMFNVVHASRDHIGFLYNGRIPDRQPGHDYLAVLPGDDPTALWSDMLPLSVNPRVDDPATGWVQANNSTPWWAIPGPEAPVETPALAQAGIESVVTNRTMRTHELLRDAEEIDRDLLLATKWDGGLAADAPMREKLLEPLASRSFDDPDLEALQQILLDWDGRFVEGSVGAGVAVAVWRPLHIRGYDVLPEWELESAMARAAAHLKEHFGRLDVPLDEVSRLRRGDVDLPLLGGPDILHCSYTTAAEDGRFVGHGGDGFVMHVEFTPTGVVSQSIHQYGAAPGRPESLHHADQAPLFVKRAMKPVLRDESAIRRFLAAEYTPGEDWAPKAGDPFEKLARAQAIAPAPPPKVPLVEPALEDPAAK
jgi:acyl-homoserine lactone acylase PvdQ